MVDEKERPKMVMGIVERLGKKKAGADESTDDDEADESDDESAQASAGEEFADAVKSGDGAEIYRSFEALMELCQRRAK